MRRTSLSLSALLVLLSNASSVPGQHEHHGIHKMAADARVEVLDDAAGQVLTVRAGPINLPARSDHTAVAQAPELFLEIPFDCWIVAYHPRLVDADGAVLPGRLLHHVGYWNTARSDFLCPHNEEHIFGAGGEMDKKQQELIGPVLDKIQKAIEEVAKSQKYDYVFDKSSRGMPNQSTSMLCNRTMSPTVITGNDMAYGQPVAGLTDAGPVVPRHPPSTFVHSTK